MSSQSKDLAKDKPWAKYEMDSFEPSSLTGQMRGTGISSPQRGGKEAADFVPLENTTDHHKKRKEIEDTILQDIKLNRLWNKVPEIEDHIKITENSKNNLMKKLIEDGNIDKVNEVKRLLGSYSYKHVIDEIEKNNKNFKNKKNV